MGPNRLDINTDTTHRGRSGVVAVNGDHVAVQRLEKKGYVSRSEALHRPCVGGGQTCQLLRKRSTVLPSTDPASVEATIHTQPLPNCPHVAGQSRFH